MRKFDLAAIGAALLTAGTVATVPATATAADWKPTRDIDFIIPYGPGGGFDTIVRKLSPFVEKHLAADVNVIPKNVTGGRGSKAAITLTKAKPDGTKMMIFNIPGHALPNIKGDTSRYDLNAYTWLGRIAKGSYVVAVSGQSGFKSFQDLLDLDRPVKNPELGPGGTSYMMSTILWNTFGKDVKFITGYKSSSAYALAVIRGDGDATMLAAGSFRKYIGGSLKDKKIGPHDLAPVLELTTGKSGFGVKTAGDYGHPEVDRLGLERHVATAPETPDNIASVLEAALGKAIQDKEFIAWAEKVGRGPIAYLDGKGAAKVIAEQINIYKKYADKL